jgi:holo-[acyl-carrier protein] synthase
LQRIGTDIIEISRIAGAIEEHGESFLRRIFTDQEIACYREKIPSLAARFAAKEALMKALGHGLFAISFRDVEVLSSPEGEPTISLSGKAKHRATEIGVKELSLSLSHCREYAIATVLVRGED